MSSNNPQTPVATPPVHVTFNVIADKLGGFVSMTATRRTPSENEVKRADWNATLKRGKVTIHVVGRGDRLSDDALKDYARAYCDPNPRRWFHVDLSALDARPARPAPPLYSWLDNDPAWQEIAKIANEVLK